MGERGYLEVKDDFGNTFSAPVEKAKPTQKEKTKAQNNFTKKASKDEPELEELDDDIPF